MIGYAQLAFPPSERDQDAGRAYGLPNPAQLAFIALRTMIRVFVAGMGCGKTTVGAFVTLIWMLSNPGGQALAIAPIYGQNRRQFEALMGFLERVKSRHGIDLVASAKVSPGGSEIILVNGSRVEFHSAQSRTGMFGANVGLIWHDEVELYDDPERTYQDSLTRWRQESDPSRGVYVHDRVVVMTSTAQYLTGLLKTLMDEARSQAEAYKAGTRALPPTVGCVVAPSTRAVGYGLTDATIRNWLDHMDPAMFRRAIMCELQSPPEIIYGQYISGATYPDGNVVDYTFQPENPTYVAVDWGINRPHVGFWQYVPSWDALVLFEEWGPEGSSVADTIREIRDTLSRLKLVDARGWPIARRKFMVIGDPTSNPGMAPSMPSEDHILAIDGRATANGLRWPYTSPDHPMQRSKRVRIQLVRSLLKPRAMKPRLLFSRHLTEDKERMNRFKRTRRGTYWAMREGY
ncbi:MAG: terminase family protein, partial [Pseudomonadota bacterium]